MSRVMGFFMALVLALPVHGQPSPALKDPQAKMQQLVELLKSFSDEEYKGALAQAGPAAQSPNLASRGAALSSAYTTLAGYEYRKAADKAADGKKTEYDQAYARVAGPDGTIETGWQVDLLKWVGNAALNYWLKGGQDFMGGGGVQPGAEASGRGAYTESAAEVPADAAPEAHFKKGAEYERLAKESVKPDTSAERAADRRERLKRMAELLKSVSDEEYLQIRKQAPKEETRAPQVATRAKALESVYAALAAVEYEAAGLPLKEGAPSPEEAGWQVDLFKWLGNAALNYWLYGGRDFTGRGPAGSKAADLERTAAGLDARVQDPALGADKRVEAGRQLGSTYEQLAAAALEPESDAEKAARKAERVRMLAELLEAVTAEEYKEAVDLVPAEGGARAHLASQEAMLKSAYSTLAALEYHEASRTAPKDAVEPYAAGLERVSRDAGKDLVIRPKDLQETGWGAKLLGIAALGGIGYAIYENQRHHGRGRPRVNPHYTPGPPSGGGGGGAGPGGGGFPYDGLWTMRWKTISKSGRGTLQNCHSVHPVVVSKGKFSSDGSQCGSTIGVSGEIGVGGLVAGKTTTGGAGLPFTFAGKCVSRNACHAEGQNNIGEWKLDLLPPGAAPCPDGLAFDRGQCVERSPVVIKDPEVVVGGGRKTINPVCMTCKNLPCGCDCYGMPRVCPQDRRQHASLREAARAVEGQLGRQEWSGEQAASLHGHLAALYEDLAGGPKPEAPPAVEAPVEKPAVQEPPAEKAPTPPVPAPPKKRAVVEDPVKTGIKEMEDVEKKMRQGIESRKGP